ncbi:hypothetical protein [Nonomuraea sp. KM90]|uniref:hypothetical protein n=1 Tax=Nonomuraea sp. KM90 TaxID=3457428 RepID=UPI003FCC9E9B
MSVKGQAEGIKHGTWGGYKQHLHREVEMCDACREACRLHSAKLKAAKRGPVAAKTKAEVRPKLQRSSHPQQRPAPGMGRMYIRPYSPHPPGWQDPAWGVPVLGGELAVGDVLVHVGREYPITHFEPYVGGLDQVLGKGARVARSGPTWPGLPISLDRTYRIRPREGR